MKNVRPWLQCLMTKLSSEIGSNDDSWFVGCACVCQTSNASKLLRLNAWTRRKSVETLQIFVNGSAT